MVVQTDRYWYVRGRAGWPAQRHAASVEPEGPMTDPAKPAPSILDFGLFTGVPQHENFCRVDELVATRPIPASPTPRPWPAGDPEELPKAFSFAGAERSTAAFLQDTDTAAVLVLRDGAVRTAWYGLTGGPDVRWLSMSVAKSVVSALVGIAVEEGAIGGVQDAISDYVPVDPGSAYDGVTIRDVLRMSSGARWNEDYNDPTADIFRLGAAMAGADGGLDRFVAAMVPEAEPGTVCRYNSGDTQALGALLRRATGRTLTDYTTERLTDPLGTTAPGAWLVDPAGTEVAFAGLLLTAEDFARVGELYRNGGRVGDHQVVPEAWVRDSTRWAAPHLAPGAPIVGDHRFALGYGHQWWLPDGDRGEFSAIGVYNQFVYVDPPSGTVVVKLSANRRYGTTPDEATNREEETIALLRAIARTGE